MINTSTTQYNWTVEQNCDGRWELIYWPRGDSYTQRTHVELRADNWVDAVNEGKYALYA